MKNSTIVKIREACNKLVYQWKREYEKCVKNNELIPQPITIPKIAKRADVAPKTIYTVDEYKTVALIAISKTTVCSCEEDIDFYPDKDIFKKSEVKIITKGIVNKFEPRIKELTKIIMEKTSAIVKCNGEVSKLEEMLEKHAVLIVQLENENAFLEGQIKLLNTVK
jgi:DNA-directed RNA polymerase beta subunit